MSAGKAIWFWISLIAVSRLAAEIIIAVSNYQVS